MKTLETVKNICKTELDRCVKAVRLEVYSCAERDSLEDGGEIIRYRLEDGFHTFGTSIFDGAAFTRTFTMVYSYVSPANALVIVLALNAKCRVVLLASANGTIPNVGE